MGRKIKGKFTFMNTNIEQNKLTNLGVLKCLSIYTNERFSYEKRNRTGQIIMWRKYGIITESWLEHDIKRYILFKKDI